MEMLSCELNRDINTPLYEQLYDYIKTEIIEGRLAFGSKLPSKRNLAEFLQISGNTVETAYEQLTAEGYVEVIARKGYYVMAFEDLELFGAKSSVEEFEGEHLEQVLYDFHPSQIDTERFPYNQWRKYAKNVIDEQHQELLLLGNAQGEFELRREIATYLYHARGVKCAPEQIIIGAGSEILLHQLVLLFEKKAVYGVEDPGYHVIQKILKRYNNRVFPLEVDEEGIQVGAVKRFGLDVVYVTPSHHFPYGTVMSVNRRTKLLNWAAAHENRYIIEDDYDSEFRYSGKTIPALQSMDYAEKVIYLGSFSKSLMPSIRISYMVLPKPLLTRYFSELNFYQSTVSRIDQHVVTEFMKQGDFEKHLNKMRTLYRRKFEQVAALLKPFQNQIRIIGERAGLHTVLVVDNGMDENTLVQKARDHLIEIYPMSAYSLGAKTESKPQMILGFAGIPEKELEKAVKLLLKSWGFE
jgi:GntR family transcriptional regulator / MocR family aminotransferase